jgi:hypothetical protein
MLLELNYEKTAFTKRIWEKAGPFGLTWFFQNQKHCKSQTKHPLSLWFFIVISG